MGRPLPQLDPVADRGLDDLFFFGREIWGLDLLREQPHRQMANDLMDIYRGESGRDFLMNRVPRDCFKTTFGSVCFAAWVQLNEIYRKENYEYRIFFNAATKEKSWRLIQKIIDKVEYDQKLALLYGDLKGKKEGISQFSGYNLSPRYTKGEISVISDANFFCGSVVSEQTGSHSDMNISDDLSEEKNSGTKAQRDKVKASYQNALSILRKDGGKQVMNCTAWHDDDVSSEIIRREVKVIEEKGESASRWIIRNHGAILEDGSLYFPERLTMDVLNELKHEYGTFRFQTQYMNDPAGVGNLVTEQMIRVKDPRMFPVLEKIRVTVDPAYGEDEKENGDFYWITIAGYDRFNTEFVLSARYSQSWGGMGFVDQLFAIEKDYAGYERIYIEAEHATFLKTLINLEEAKRGISLRIRWIVRPRYLDKWTRHLCFQSRFENGRIFFSSDIPTDAMQEMREQLLRAPYGAHDDFLDTLADQESAQTKMKHDDEATKPNQMVVAPIDQERVVMVMKSFYNHETRRIEGRLVPKQLPPDVVSFESLM